MDVVAPFMLVDGDREAMEFVMEPGTYNAALNGDGVYVEGDLVEISSGTVRKRITTLDSSVELYLAGAAHSQPFALPYLLARGVPLNVIPSRNQFVFSFSGTYQQAKDAALARAKRDVTWDNTNKCLVVANSTNAPRATVLGIFKGASGDSNPQVIVRLDSAAGA